MLRLRLIGVGLAVAIAAALSIVSPRAAEPPQIAIGLIAPLTGGTTAQGVSIRNGAQLAVEEINASGGVLGRKIELVIRDDASTNELGAKIARELTNDHQIVAAVGIANTGVAIAAEPAFEENEVPLIVSAATGTLVTTRFAPPGYETNYIFRVAANDRLQSSLLAAMAVARGYSRPAIFHDTTSYGRLGRADLQAALGEYNLKPVAIEKFNIGDTEMSEQLDRARAAGADVIITYGIGPELAHIAMSRAEIGWQAPLIGSWTLSMASFTEGAGSAGEGALMPQTFIETPNTPGHQAFIDAYRRHFETAHIPTPPAGAQSYDAVKLLAAAITQANSTDGPAIRRALENLEEAVDGVIATYRHPFSTQDHEAIHRSNMMFGVVHHGIVIAAPRDGS
jgi:branched-chain amino acid transport system substrate-binding protein